jgi:hypothetical protein
VVTKDQPDRLALWPSVSTLVAEKIVADTSRPFPAGAS